jgi:hypothetical protein
LRDPDRKLYLAVPKSLRELLVEEKDFRFILQEFQASIIFYSDHPEEALEWIEQQNIV